MHLLTGLFAALVSLFHPYVPTPAPAIPPLSPLVAQATLPSRSTAERTASAPPTHIAASRLIPAEALQDAVHVATDTDELRVSASQEPAPTIAPSGAGGVPFTTFTLTAGATEVTINSITVERAGAGEDGAFDSIALNNENGDQIGDEESFHSDHKALLDGQFTVPAHTSETLTIVGNMTDDLSEYDGQMPALAVEDIDASSPVVGTLPVTGTAQTVNASLAIGSATASLSSYDPDADSTHAIGDTGIRFSGIRISAASQEDLTLSSITWTQNGTAAAADIMNVVTVVDGVAYPAEADGRAYTSTFSPAIVIRKGQTVDAYVQGDLTESGSLRTVEFDIDDSGDVALTGNSYGYGVGLAAGGNTAMDGHSAFITSDGTTDGDEGTPFFEGSVVHITDGTPVYIGNAN